MKVIIIEDERLSAEYLENLLKKTDSTIEVISVIGTVKKSIELLSSGIKADLLFVDVHLADGLSFEIFSALNTTIPIIFTTAYDEYAIKAFKLNSVDYLLKPVAITDLSNALEKFKKITLNYNIGFIQDLASVYQNQRKGFKNRFMVKLGDTITTVKTDEISHFISEDGMVMLNTTIGKKYPLDFTLDHLENVLDPDSFFRINRKVILHISSVNKVGAFFNSRLKISLESLKDEDGVVSRERVNDFKKWLDK